MSSHPAQAPLARAIAALTYDEIEQASVSDFGVQTTLSGTEVPLLQRSIAQDLVRIESAIGAKGRSLMGAIAASIDEALLAIAEAQALIAGDAA